VHRTLNVGIGDGSDRPGDRPPRQQWIENDPGGDSRQQEKEDHTHASLPRFRDGQAAINVPRINTMPPIHSQTTSGLIST
jgi:hypothetical protein